MSGKPACKMVMAFDENPNFPSIYVTVDGLVVAKRGLRGTPDWKKWVVIEPDYKVSEVPGITGITIERNGVEVGKITR
jgi:hypothetical protein